MPKWRGSKNAMFRFARNSARNAPPNTLIPFVLVKAHWETYYRADNQDTYFKHPAVWKEVKTVYTLICSQFPESMVKYNWFARAAYLAGDYEKAKELFQVINDEWDDSVWGSYKDFIRIKNDVNRAAQQ